MHTQKRQRVKRSNNNGNIITMASFIQVESNSWCCCCCFLNNKKQQLHVFTVHTWHTLCEYVFVCVCACLCICVFVSAWQIGQHSQLCKTDINKIIWNIVEFKGKFMAKCQALLQIEFNNGNSINNWHTHTHYSLPYHAILYKKKEQRPTLRTIVEKVNRKWIE